MQKEQMNLTFYENKGSKKIAFVLITYPLSFLYGFIAFEPIFDKLKLFAIMLIFGIPVYMYITAMTWDIILTDNTIAFTNRYNIFVSKYYSFTLKDIKEVNLFLSGRGGPALQIKDKNSKTTSFQTIGKKNSLMIIERLKEKEIPITVIHNIFHKERFNTIYNKMC